MLAEIGTLAMLTLSTANLTFDYELHPFWVGNHANARAFEAFLDELGERGFLAQGVWLNDLGDPADDLRFFYRQLGGEPTRADYAIRRFPVQASEGVDRWVPAYDELGRNGELVTALYGTGAGRRAVTVKYFIGGRLVVHRWELEPMASVFEDPDDLRRAAKDLARRGYVFIAAALDDGRTDLYAIGQASTTSGRLPKVRLRFKRSREPWSPARLERETDKQGRKGYRLAQMAGERSGWLYIFAQVIEDGRKTRLDCVVDSFDPDGPPEDYLALLNQRGAQGFAFAGGWPTGRALTPVLLTCDPQ